MRHTGMRCWARVDTLQAEQPRICVVLKMKVWRVVKCNEIHVFVRQMERFIFLRFEVTKSKLMRKLNLHVQMDSVGFFLLLSHAPLFTKSELCVCVCGCVLYTTACTRRHVLTRLCTSARLLSQEVIMSMLGVWAMEMSMPEEWHIEHKEVWDILRPRSHKTKPQKPSLSSP